MFHLQCLVKELFAPLNRIRGAAVTTSQPILGQVLLVGTTHSVILTTTDLSITMREAVSDVAANGEVLLPADKLLAILKLLPPDAELAIGTDAAGRSTFSTDHSHYTFSTFDVMDFPAIQASHPLYRLLISGYRLGEMLDRVKHAQGRKDVRSYLNGVLLEVRDRALIACATNGHMLAVARCDSLALEESAPIQAILPTRAVNQLHVIADRDGDVQLTFLGAESGAVPTLIEAVSGPLSMTAHLIDGRFPDYAKILPDSFQGWLEADRTLLARLCQRVLICAHREYHGLRLEAGIDDLVISAADGDSEATETQPIERSGRLPDAYTLNGEYLLATLATVKSDRLKLHFRDPGQGVEVNIPEQTDWRVIIMPMRV